MDRHIIVPVRRMNIRNSMSFPGVITSENLFASSPLFLQQFQTHNGEIESLSLREPKIDIPIVKPRSSLSPQNNNNCNYNETNYSLAKPVALPQPLTQRTLFFPRDEHLIEIENEELSKTPVPKPRPKSTVSPINDDLSSWVQVNGQATSYVNSNGDQSIDQYLRVTTGKRKIPVQDDAYGYGGQRYDDICIQKKKKPRHESNTFCNIL